MTERPTTSRGLPEELEEIENAGEMVVARAHKPARTLEEAKRTVFEYWDAQPVAKLEEVVTTNEAILTDKELEESPAAEDPLALPEGYMWAPINPNDAGDVKDLYVLLNENYVEDKDSKFRFDYQDNFLKWALMPPGYDLELFVGMRAVPEEGDTEVKAGGKGELMGFISGIPVEIMVNGAKIKAVEINFLCVHKSIRGLHFAPIIMDEMQRRIHKLGIYQGCYTAGIVMPSPFASCVYYHRDLNCMLLCETDFSPIPDGKTLAEVTKMHKLPRETKCGLWRPMASHDIPQAYELLMGYLRKFKLYPALTMEEFEHFLTPKQGIVDTYVVKRDGKITDMVSYYSLPFTVMGHRDFKRINTAYLYYYAATSMPLKDLLKDGLIIADRAGFDLFNALDIMDNTKELLEELLFGKGDGNLFYYVFNWKTPGLAPNEIGFILP